MGVPVEVEIDHTALNEHLTKVILESYIGKDIEETIRRAAREALTGRYGNDGVAHQVAREVIRNIALEVLNEQKEELAAQIREVLTDEWVKERISEVTSKIHIVTDAVN